MATVPSEGRDLMSVEKNVHMRKLMNRAQKDPNSVEKSDLEELLQSQKEQRDSFLKLPFTILFFTFFCVSVLNHEKVADSSMMQRQLRGMLSGTTFEGVAITSGHKDLGDIDTAEDWYLYMEEALIPMFINDLTVPIEDRHRVLRYNQLIGGLQIQQVRRRRVLCSTEYPELGPFPRAGRTNPILADFGCYPWYTESDDCYGPWNSTMRDHLKGGFCPDSKRDQETGVGFARRLDDDVSRRLDFVPEAGGSGSSTKGARATPGPDQLFSVYMYEHDGLNVAQEKLKHLQDNSWIDFNTAWVGVRMFVFNPDLAIFVHVTVHVYFATSGALLPHITAQSFAPDPYQDMYIITFDAIWLTLLMWLVYQLFAKLHKAARTAACREFLLDAWIWVDAGTVVGGMAIIVLWLVFLDKLVLIKRLAMDVKALQPQTGFTSEEFPKAVAAMHSNLADLSDYLMNMRLVFSLYTIFISLKFLESFSAQPRLAVVTRTIWNAGSELFHFLIVLLTMFFSYVVAGMFIFGRRLWEFSEFKHAVSKCFLLMLGDFDWEELGDENPLTAAFWFWTFMILMTLLMMNMMMAIIMDKYTEVKSDAAEHDTIVKQVQDMIVEAIQSTTGNKVGLGQLLEKVKGMQDDDINEEMLMEEIDGLSREQARHLIKKTKERVKAELNKGVTISEAMRMIGWTKIAVQKIGWRLEEVLKDEREEHDALHSFSERRSAGPSHAQHRDPLPAAFDSESHGRPVLISENTSDLGAGADRVAGGADMAITDGNDRGPPYVAEAEERLEAIERRMQRMEDFMQEALRYTEFRGKDLRNRLAIIEDLLRSQRDALLINVDRGVWDRDIPRVRDRREEDRDAGGWGGGGLGGGGGRGGRGGGRGDGAEGANLFTC
uniref:Polycystin cation channel PKD1/PKD2 domain-containing protein n=1 Tax=Alexandrium catenella TaxID=2925 RepID=A0A7S1QZJ8_ALECA